MAPSATVSVNKLAAAQRQIDCAIRIYFYDEDKLSIHNIINGAYCILRDLKQQRKQSELEDITESVYYYAVVDYIQGKMPESIKKSDFIQHVIVPLTAYLKENNLTVEQDSVSASIPKFHQKRFWEDFKKHYNYLKHADRDPWSLVEESEINNYATILMCIGSYTDFMKMTNEMYVFWLYSCACMGQFSRIPENMKEFVNTLSNISEYEKYRLCNQMLQDLRDQP